MCGICFKVLGSKSSLDTHTRSIHENRKFPCNDCGEIIHITHLVLIFYPVLVTIASILNHYIPLFTKHYPGKRFFDRSTLRRHKKCIHENITHRCKFCSLEFSRRHYLTSHVHKEHPGKVEEAEMTGNKTLHPPLPPPPIPPPPVVSSPVIGPIGFYNEVDGGTQS